MDSQTFEKICHKVFRDFSENVELSLLSIKLFDHLLSFQCNNGIKGDLLEIGINNGITSGILLNYATENEILICVDPFCDFKKVDSNIKNLKFIATNPVKYIQDKSQKLDGYFSDSYKSSKTKLRFIHIDGEHSYVAVYRDLNMAAKFLHEEGLIVVDDFGSKTSVCVSHAIFDFIRNRTDFSIFCVAEGKCYICRTPVRGILRRNIARWVNDGENLRCIYQDFDNELGYVSIIEVANDTEKFQGIGAVFKDLNELIYLRGGF